MSIIYELSGVTICFLIGLIGGKENNIVGSQINTKYKELVLALILLYQHQNY